METLYLGYAYADFTPDNFPIRMNSQLKAEFVMEPIGTVCMSFRQAETHVLVYDMDLRQPTEEFQVKVLPLIAQALGMDKKNIVLACPHNHSCPDVSNQKDASVLQWQEEKFLPAMIAAGKAAMADERQVLSMEGGTTHTEYLNFVRRYMREDGTWFSVASANPSKAPFAAHESEADTELRAVRIKRQGGKDVVLVSYQVHAAGALARIKDAINADYVGTLRKTVGEAEDCLVFHIQGACGNLNYFTKLAHEKPLVDSGHVNIGQKLSEAVSRALKNTKPLAIGQLKYCRWDVVSPVNHTKDHLYEIAKAIGEIEDPEKQVEMMHANGIDNRYERSAIIRRMDMPEERPVPFACLTFGDVAMAFAPMEMFDELGLYLRKISPFAMTLFSTYALSYHGYMPSFRYVPHGEYEVVMCNYLPGSGENFILEICAKLQEMYR